LATARAAGGVGRKTITQPLRRSLLWDVLGKDGPTGPLPILGGTKGTAGPLTPVRSIWRNWERFWPRVDRKAKGKEGYLGYKISGAKARPKEWGKIDPPFTGVPYGKGAQALPSDRRKDGLILGA